VVRYMWMAIPIACVIAACATEVHRINASLTAPPSGVAARIEISRDTHLQPSGGYDRTLPQGSVWDLHGGLPQGAVYRRSNGIFTVEGAHVHEAYIVVAGNRLVGFYQPVERAYSPLDPSVALNVKR
jgi:hypothetical protein